MNFIFQPGEEGIGGALAMLEDGLFERFPCDAIFAMHNRPACRSASSRSRKGPHAAGGAFFDITSRAGRARRAAGAGIDPVLVAATSPPRCRSMVARNVAPSDTAVLSVTRIVGGDAYNVIPQTGALSGTARAFKPRG